MIDVIAFNERFGIIEEKEDGDCHAKYVVDLFTRDDKQAVMSGYFYRGVFIKS